MHDDISFTVHLFKEGGVFVAHVPEFDLSSCGDTPEEARQNIRDANVGFLATLESMGTLDEILEEAGYRRKGQQWTPPEFVSFDRLTVNLPA